MPDHDGTGPLTELFGPTAIFSIRPCSREEATRCAEARWRHPPRPAPSVAELESAVDADVIDDDHDYYDEEDF
jgi:hypothetical protein